MRSFVLVTTATLLLSGCGYLTGPNRMFRVVSNTSNFSTFEGMVTTTCGDVMADIGDTGQPSVVGCVLMVVVDGEVERRHVFFPRGDMYKQAQSIPVGARISVNGRPIGAGLSYEAQGVEWRR